MSLVYFDFSNFLKIVRTHNLKNAVMLRFVSGEFLITYCQSKILSLIQNFTASNRIS